MRPESVAEAPMCWNCGAPVHAGASEARYLYRGPRARTAIVEDWIACACGAYQNVRQVKEIVVSAAHKKA